MNPGDLVRSEWDRVARWVVGVRKAKRTLVTARYFVALGVVVRGTYGSLDTWFNGTATWQLWDPGRLGAKRDLNWNVRYYRRK